MKLLKKNKKAEHHNDDVIMTPLYLAEKLVNHFKPQGKGLEPCCGIGNILRFLPNADWCEINVGKDFFDYNEKVDYIFTSPPWSQVKAFLNHSMELADDIYFLITINHLWTKSRLRNIKCERFGIKEICCCETPKEFVNIGFQLGMVHLQRNYEGEIKLTWLEE